MKSVHFVLLAALFFLSTSYAGGGWSHFEFYVNNNTAHKIYLHPYEPKAIAPQAWICMSVDSWTPQFIEIKPGAQGKVRLAFHTIGSCLGGKGEGVYVMGIRGGKSAVEIAQATVGFQDADGGTWSISGVSENSAYVITTNGANEFYVAPAS